MTPLAQTQSTESADAFLSGPKRQRPAEVAQSLVIDHLSNNMFSQKKRKVTAIEERRGDGDMIEAVDKSMNMIETRQEYVEKAENGPEAGIQERRQDDDEPGNSASLKRGRTGYDNLGILRTKPGMGCKRHYSLLLIDAIYVKLNHPERTLIMNVVVQVEWIPNRLYPCHAGN